jgi:hypothetical protein
MLAETAMQTRRGKKLELRIEGIQRVRWVENTG